MWIASLKLLLPAAALALFVLADASVVDSAAIAAIASLANTWIILRHDRKVSRLERRVADLQRQLRAKRIVTRDQEDRARVLDIEPMQTMAKQIIEGEER